MKNKRRSAGGLAHGVDFSARKMAPRSSNQFRIGPPFGPTIVEKIIMDERNSQVSPEISARVDRGFDMIDGDWVGYKRNYFTLVASFQFLDLPLNICNTSQFRYLEGNIHVCITSFKLCLRHTCRDQESYRTTLVQHTAKRDRGPQFEPPEYLIVPGELPPHEIMRELANIRNGPKISFYDRLFYMLNKEREEITAKCDGIISTYPPDSRVALVARYERIQFQTIAIGSRRALTANSNLTFLVIQFVGVADDGTEVVLASSTSAPLTIRGRSPLNYTRSKPIAQSHTKQDATGPNYELVEQKEPICGTANAENEIPAGMNQKKRKVVKILGVPEYGRVLRRNQSLENLANFHIFDDVTMRRVAQIRKHPAIQKINKSRGQLKNSSSSSSSQNLLSSNYDPAFGRWCRVPYVAEDVIQHELCSEENYYFEPGSPSKYSNTGVGIYREGTVNISGAYLTLFASSFLKHSNFFKEKLTPYRKRRSSITLVQESPSNERQVFESLKDLPQVFATEDEILNVPLKENLQHSEQILPSIGPMHPNLPDMGITCPLGYFLPFPTNEYQIFLQTSTPVGPTCVDKIRSLGQEKAALDQHTKCTHGFKRNSKKHSIATKSYGSEDFCEENYDSSFSRLIGCLDKIKNNIRLVTKEELLSSLSSLDPQQDEMRTAYCGGNAHIQSEN